uniref:FCP1 homology domain-containing protein n=1 Tax=Eimeria tenella TaxID=5802 RepID=H9B972_EIMTE|nr:hypothetical protein [Eimeria tenella]
MQSPRIFNYLSQDLSRLGRRLDRLVYVSCTEEGLEEKFLPNFIKVTPFEGTAAEAAEDCELLSLINFLKHCSLSPDDVRSSISRYGGGTIPGVGSRFNEAKRLQETKATQRRSIGRFLGFTQTQGAPNFLGAGPPGAAPAGLGGPLGGPK